VHGRFARARDIDASSTGYLLRARLCAIKENKPPGLSRHWRIQAAPELYQDSRRSAFDAIANSQWPIANGG
jgi:hypothetical protein